MKNWIKKIKWSPILNIILSLILVLVFKAVGLNFSVEKSNDLPKVVLRVGIPSEAFNGTPDYIGLTSVEVLQALNALPATGGEIELISPVYTFSATLSRAIDNVTIKGQNGTTINYDGVNPVFDVGVQDGWTFIDLKTDAGGIDYTTATNCILENVELGTTNYAYLTSDDCAVVAGNLVDLSVTDDHVLYADGGGELYNDGGFEYDSTNNRLNVDCLELNGKLSLGSSTELTLSSNTVTATRGYHTIAGEGGVADSLDTINGGLDGGILIIRPSSDTVDITVTDDGNIVLAGASDFVMNNNTDVMLLFYSSTLTKWLEVSRSDN